VSIEEATLIVVGVSVLLLAWQSGQVARQTRISTQVAAAAVWSETTDRLHRIVTVFLTRPEIRAYFYGGKQAPESGNDLTVVTAIAEMLADTIEGSLQLGNDIPGAAKGLQGWNSYATFLRKGSPALDAWIGEHPTWYPRLAGLFVSPQLSRPLPAAVPKV
jgi:hypothetical protein